MLGLLILSISNTEYDKTGIVFLSLIISLVANLRFRTGIIPPLKNVDPSYGTYLYAFPINQAVIASGVTNWLFSLILTISFSLFAGIVSYIFIEEKFICAFSYRKKDIGLRVNI